MVWAWLPMSPKMLPQGDFPTQRCQGTSNQGWWRWGPQLRFWRDTRVGNRLPAWWSEHLKTPGLQGLPGGTGCSVWQAAGCLGEPGWWSVGLLHSRPGPGWGLSQPPSSWGDSALYRLLRGRLAAQAFAQQHPMPWLLRCDLPLGNI